MYRTDVYSIWSVSASRALLEKRAISIIVAEPSLLKVGSGFRKF